MKVKTGNIGNITPLSTVAKFDDLWIGINWIREEEQDLIIYPIILWTPTWTRTPCLLQ